MTTTVKAKRKLGPSMMTADEAEVAIQRLNRMAADWTTELVLFAQREGWKALGYPTIRHCLADRLTITCETAGHILRAASTKYQVAELTTDKAEKTRILRLADSAALRLRRLEEPKRRLAAYRAAATEAGRNGGKISAQLVGAAVRKMTGGKAGRGPTRDCFKCPRCSGRGWLER